MTWWLTLAPTSRSTSGLRSRQTPGCCFRSGFRSKQYSVVQVSQNEANYPVALQCVYQYLLRLCLWVWPVPV